MPSSIPVTNRIEEACLRSQWMRRQSWQTGSRLWRDICHQWLDVGNSGLKGLRVRRRRRRRRKKSAVTDGRWNRRRRVAVIGQRRRRYRRRRKIDGHVRRTRRRRRRRVKRRMTGSLQRQGGMKASGRSGLPKGLGRSRIRRIPGVVSRGNRWRRRRRRRIVNGGRRRKKAVGTGSGSERRRPVAGRLGRRISIG